MWCVFTTEWPPNPNFCKTDAGGFAGGAAHPPPPKKKAVLKKIGRKKEKITKSRKLAKIVIMPFTNRSKIMIFSRG